MPLGQPPETRHQFSHMAPGEDRPDVEDGRVPHGRARCRTVHPDDRARVVRGIHRAIDGGAESWSDEYQFLRYDGTAAHVFDRGYIIHSGQVLMEGQADDIINHPDVRRLYLGENFRL